MPSSNSFLPLSIAVLTISDTRTEETDSSGAYLISSLEEAGHHLAARKIIPDDLEKIVEQLRLWIADNHIDVILSTGGTGLTARDITPEALAEVVEKWIPGFGELFRFLSYQKIGTSTIQSRACAGAAGDTLIFALPGSTGACRDAWEGILKAQLDIRHRPCNFAEILPRMAAEGCARK